MLVLLALELEALAVVHSDELPAAWEIAYPIFRYMVVAFCALGALIVSSAGLPARDEAARTPITIRLSLAYLATHLSYVVVFSFLISPLWQLTGRFALSEIFWVPLTLLFVLSWLAAFVPPRVWWQNLRGGAHWAFWAGLFTVGSLVVMHLCNQIWNHWLSAPTTLATYSSSRFLLLMIYPDLTSHSDTLSLGTAVLHGEVRPECVGYDGAKITSMITLSYLWLRRRELSFPAAFILVPLGMAAIWLVNCFRIALLLTIASSYSTDVATVSFHQQAGWLGILMVSWSLILLVEKTQLFRQTPIEPDQEYAAAPLILPLATLLLGWILSRAFSYGFDILYPARLVAVATVLWLYRRSYPVYFCSRPGWRAALVGFVLYLVWIGLAHPASEPAPTEVLGPVWGGLWIGLRMVGAVIAIPLAEELAFRGFFVRWLQSPDFETVPIGQLTLAAWLISSLAFGLLHQERLPAVVAGLAYCALIRNQGALSEAVAAHATTNFCLVLHVLATRQWGLWN